MTGKLHEAGTFCTWISRFLLAAAFVVGAIFDHQTCRGMLPSLPLQGTALVVSLNIIPPFHIQGSLTRYSKGLMLTMVVRRLEYESV